MRGTDMKVRATLAGLFALALASAAHAGQVGEGGGGGTAPAGQCEGRDDYHCDASADRYTAGGSVTVTDNSGTSTSYTRTSAGTMPSLTANTMSAPFVVYFRNNPASVAEGPDGLGTGAGANCQLGEQFSAGSCTYGVMSGGATGDERVVTSYTRQGSVWFDGSATAICSASGWALKGGTSTCAGTSDPGTSCGGCTFEEGTGWRCTFCN